MSTGILKGKNAGLLVIELRELLSEGKICNADSKRSVTLETVVFRVAEQI